MPATATQTPSRQALRENQNRNGRPRESRAIDLLNKRDRQIAALKAENAELGALIEQLNRQLNQATR
jgi:hypothetical protein